MDWMELRPSGDVIRAMFGYMRWADEAVVRAAEGVPDEGYYRERGVSHGSIHALLVHSMAAQEGWLRRWRGEGEARIGTVADCPTREGLKERWPGVHREVMEFVEGQGEEGLGRPVRARNTYGEWFTLPLAATMLHVVDHATYHRGQINTMIKQAGGSRWRRICSGIWRWEVKKIREWGLCTTGGGCTTGRWAAQRNGGAG